MGFMDKAKKLAEQAQQKLDEAQKQFNQSQPEQGPGDCDGATLRRARAAPGARPGSLHPCSDARSADAGERARPAGGLRPPHGRRRRSPTEPESRAGRAGERGAGPVPAAWSK